MIFVILTLVFLRFLPYIGPKRHIFTDPDTGFQYEAKTRDDLIKHIRTYREQNQLEPIEMLAATIENFQCRLPENSASCEPSPDLARGFLQTIRGGVALIKRVFFGAKYLASQEEADRRSEICINCPANVNPDPKTSKYTAWADEIALHSTNGLKSKHHKKLFNCTVCTCPLRAKVFYKGPFSLSKHEVREMNRVNPRCWQLNNIKLERK